MMKVGDLVKYKEQFASVPEELDKHGMIIDEVGAHVTVAFGEILKPCHRSMLEVVN